MDIKEYITSGIIERYVLNSVSPQEKQEVECMSHIYPEIKEELTSLQSSIEQLVLKTAVPVPSHLKDKIIDKIKREAQEPLLKKVSSTETKVISINRSNHTFKYLAVACFAGIIALGVYISKINNAATELEQKLVAEKSITKELESLSDLTNEQLAFLKHNATNKVIMNGTEAHPEMLATVFCNTTSEKVMMEVQNLPETAKNKQYQLWAIIEGVPTDMGLFDVNSTKSGLIDVSFAHIKTPIDMSSVNNAVAFAVTLEPKGGSKTPTMEQMMVIGNV